MNGPAANKSLVIELVKDELSDNNVVPEADLKARVEKRVTESGRTLSGLALRFKEALAESRFVNTPAGIRLKQNNQHLRTATD